VLKQPLPTAGKYTRQGPLCRDPVSYAVSISVFPSMFQQELELDGRWSKFVHYILKFRNNMCFYFFKPINGIKKE